MFAQDPDPKRVVRRRPPKEQAPVAGERDRSGPQELAGGVPQSGLSSTLPLVTWKSSLPSAFTV